MIAVSDAIARLSAALGDGPAAQLAAAALIEADALGLPRFGVAMLDEWTADAAQPATGEPRAIRWLDCSSSFAPLAVAAAKRGREPRDCVGDSDHDCVLRMGLPRRISLSER